MINTNAFFCVSQAASKGSTAQSAAVAEAIAKGVGAQADATAYGQALVSGLTGGNANAFAASLAEAVAKEGCGGVAQALSCKSRWRRCCRLSFHAAAALHHMDYRR